MVKVAVVPVEMKFVTVDQTPVAKLVVLCSIYPCPAERLLMPMTKLDSVEIVEVTTGGGGRLKDPNTVMAA